MSLFKRNKPTLDSISFPTFGWELEKDEAAMRLWMNSERSSAISVNFFSKRPDLPKGLALEDLLSFYREQLVDARGGLIEVEKVDLKGFQCIKTIFKIPQDPAGTTYLGSLTVPFAKYSYVIKVQAAELENVGEREKKIASRLLMANEIRSVNGQYEDWESDPYDAAYQQGSRMNKSEEAVYDKDFLRHPLTNVRNILRLVMKQVEFKEVLGKLK